MSDRPFVVVIRSTSGTEVVQRGWRIVPLERLPAEPFDLRGWKLAAVASDIEDEAAILMAGLRGCSIVLQVLDGSSPPGEHLLEDLGRILEATAPAGRDPLDDDQIELLRRLADGVTLVDAAHQLGMSRRTAMRRLADARRRLGVSSTMTAIRAARDTG